MGAPDAPGAGIGNVLGGKLRVRRAERRDAAAIGEAHAEAWRVGYANLFSASSLEALVAERRTRWTGLLAEGHLDGDLIVAEDADGVVVGFIHVGPAHDEEYHGGVYGLYVQPGAWGSGVAAALLTEGTSCLLDRRHRLLHLWAHRDAERARRFYEKHGWTLTGRTMDHDLGDLAPSPLVEYALRR